jgi:hypothetical protein
VDLLEGHGACELDGSRVRTQSHVVVRVDESGQHRGAAGVDLLGRRSESLGRLGVVADPRDPFAVDGYGASPRA